MFFFHDPLAAEHQVPLGHPEQPDRYWAVQTALAASEFSTLIRRTAEPASWDELLLIHTEHYVQDLDDASPQKGMLYLDADTCLSPRSVEAARMGAGLASAATRAVMQGESRRAFCLTRPPGHHAESDKAMGFCFFNNAALCARIAQRQCGAKRVAIVDFDVHHGNGTQEIFWHDASVFFASSHEMPNYPGTGEASEQGEHGQILNVPLAPHSGGAEMREAYSGLILSRLRHFEPDLIVLSAGFDAHARDPLSSLTWHEDDFFWITQQLAAVADEKCGGRLVSCLEGGYDLKSLAGSVAAHVSALMG